MGYNLLIILFALPLVYGKPSSSSCGYNSCPRPKSGFINIHLIPHTHDDVGWLKTFDQYYYGSRNDIQDAGVQYILDSVTQELLHDPRKRFIYVETAYFWKWWQEQPDTLRHQFKKLVNRGQLEFIGGGWSMHDEATTHYQSILDQMTWGFRRLSDTFGECGRPRVGWQIDPFGHSRESASLMAHMGFDGLFLGRIDWQDKHYRILNKTAEMIWFTSSNDISDSARLFTSVMYNTYSAPKGFCFDINCHDEPVIDNKHSPEYNAPRRAADFLKIMEDYAAAYRTDNIIVTMGDDFMYQDAHVYFKNMDKLIRFINGLQDKGSKFHAFYSTPSCYLKAVHDAEIPLPTKYDDFLPYSNDPTAFWTGYFTSRPTMKRFERMGNNYLQICKQLYSLSNLGPEDKGDLIAMREAMGVMQHHDAMPGTEKQHVASDYARILTDAFKECDFVNEAAFNKLMPRESGTIKTENCMLLNISSCEVSENESSFVVTVYNPLSRPVDHLVKLPILMDSISYLVLSPDGKKVEAQTIKLSDSILNIPGRKSKAQAQLVFVATNLPPMGFRSYYVSKDKGMSKRSDEVELNGEPIIIGFKDGPKITLDGNGKLIKASMSGKSAPLEQSYYYYRGAVGNNEVFANRSSGAYIFRPNGTEIPIGDKIEVNIFKGPVLNEVHQKFSNWVSQIIRIHSGSNHVEFEWLVGPIPLDDSAGKEVISRFTSNAIRNNGEFQTDSNGRELLNRKLNFRPSWPLVLAESVPGNYYPITTTITIKDSVNRLSVVPDRAQGGSSLKDGDIDLMVHRRLIHDDAFGVGEALNETAFGKGLVAVGTHYVSFGTPAEVRALVQEKVLDSWIFLTPTNGLSFEQWGQTYNMEYSGLNSNVPPNVQILTLEPWIGKSFLLRLEHILENSDDPKWSKPAVVQIQDLFSGWKITSVEETILGANQKIGESRRLIWKTEETEMNRQYFYDKTTLEQDIPTIKLKPMEIRTFIIHVENK